MPEYSCSRASENSTACARSCHAGGACVATFTGHTHYVISVCVTPDGKRALTASEDDTMKMWDLGGAHA